MVSLKWLLAPSESRWRTKTVSEKRERKQCVEFTMHANSSNPHLHITDHPWGSVSPLPASYYPVAQTDVVGWFRRPNPGPLTKWFNTRSSRTIWGSGNPLGISDGLFDPCALWMGLNILGAQRLLCDGRRWAHSRLWPTPLDRLPINSQNGGEGRAIAFVLTL